MRPVVLTSLAIVAAGSLAGCGDDGSSKVPPLVGQAQAAMRQVKSFHLSGSDVTAHGTTIARGVWKAPGNIRLHMVINGSPVDAIMMGNHIYIRGSAKFWRAHSMPPRAMAIVAGRWVIVPPTRQFTALKRELQPESMAHCITVNLGSVRDAGRVTRNGEQLRLLELAGDKPGSAPGRVFISADGPAFVRTVEQTGPARPGGTRDPLCDADGTNDTERATTTLSRINRPVTIAAPAHPLSLDDIRSRSKGTGTV